MIDTPQIADEFADGGVFTRGQAERPARLSIKAAGEALAAQSDLDLLRVLHGTEISIRSDMALLQSWLEAALERAQERPVMWFAGTMVMHATAVIGLTVGLIRLL